MTSASTDGRRRLGGAITTALRALWSASTWRATLHVLAGLPAGVAASAGIAIPAVLWVAAVYSLLDGPTGGWVPVTLYVVVVMAVPALLPWCVQALSAMLRARFRAVLGVEFPTPSPPRGPQGRWPLRLARRWRAAGMWRQLGHHLLVAPVIGVAGVAVVAGCWSAGVLAAVYVASMGGSSLARLATGAGLAVLSGAMLLAAPRVARGVARADEAVARALLGPRRSEALAQRVESLARSRADAVAAADAERRRIERDLHDGVQQRLVSLAMHLGMARANLPIASEPAGQVIAQAHDQATQALAELRDLVRGLHPPVLTDRGLDAALSGIAARAPLPVQVRVDVPTRCSPSIEALAYFVVSEALTNVAKHAKASRAEVSAERDGARLRIVVTDDGQGGAAVSPHGGSGLRGLQQRAAAVDGTLHLHSPPGGPTAITVELPCE